jgi:L-alanine-DL-glutamate epimerase-like enolase superfamily enzyme
MPHTFYHGPGLLAAIHVTAALGTSESLVEWRYSDLEAWPYDSQIAPAGGRIPVPQGPGLGADPDLAALRPYLRS